MKHSVLSIWASSRFSLGLYWKHAPLKLIFELSINAAKKIMEVVTSVWLLDFLTELILAGVSYPDALFPLAVVTILNILICLLDSYYTNCIKPAGDLRVQTAFEKLLLQHAETLPLRCFENSDFYTNVHRAKDAAAAVFSTYTVTVQAFGNVAAFLSAAFVAVKISPLLLLFLLFTVPMISVSKRFGSLSAEKKLALAFWTRKKQYALSIWLNKSYVRLFKTTHADRIPDSQYQEAYDAATGIHETLGKKLFAQDLLKRGFSITYISIITYFLAIVAYTQFNLFDISDFSVLIVSVMNVVSRIRKLYQGLEVIQENQLTLTAVQTFLAYSGEDVNEDGLAPGPFRSLEFRNVWFSYDKKNWVLKNVSFSISAGEKISVAGYNGAGKTTLIKLLLRFYDVDRGEILYNGIPVSRYNLCLYRAVFSAAFQEFQTYALPVTDNILMGNNATNQDTVTDALLKIDLGELTGQENRILGRELDTTGLVLSGGQQQKLAVARLLTDAFEVALLDEPSSALDPISSANMLNTVLTAAGERTVIMISHDMSFSKRADKILFFEEGNLTESGSHDMLMKNNQNYAVFFNSQAEAFGIRSQEGEDNNEE